MRTQSSLLISILCGSLVCSSVTVSGQVDAGLTSSAGSLYVNGELLIKFEGEVQGASAATTPHATRHQTIRHFDFIGWQHIRLPDGMTVEDGLEHYRSLPEVEAVEPNYLTRLNESEPAPSMVSATGDDSPEPIPDDPLFSEQWGLEVIGATNAWVCSTGSSDGVVAVIDTGITYDHEDLAANMWHNPGEIPDNDIDDDGNGYVDDVHGLNAVDDTGDPYDLGFQGGQRYSYHGTGVAGIIGARGNNGLGLAGVAWDVRLMSVRIISTNRTISLADRLQAFAYVADMKQRGVNIRATQNAWGGTQQSQAEQEALDALGQMGVLHVFATLNSNTDMDVTADYPANYSSPSIIVVTGSEIDDTLQRAYGMTNVDLAAPGRNITTTWQFEPEFSGYRTSPSGFGGTSSASAHVAGAIALMAAANPAASGEDLKRALLETVSQSPAFTNKMVSNGRLNVGRAVGYVVNLIPRIETIELSGTDAILTCRGMLGRTYRVEQSDSLEEPMGWMDTGMSFVGNEDAVTVTVPTGGFAQSFYRLVLASP